ncbi:hypothetical protein CONPUDRAFT_77286 [Coniophora puteana RWD-64-598 SS2]|uniref:Uncharacterized protein n=1 Tax=Coniophora puteana (strain RWD-64-598) TaxID=741705 RepID=A0A5M3M988_CONPW|nr:uncharacterized protein CONPUDRAFT_77286 [Coniophora puteana RWD-64-598 SS2]EIW75647.1 hypothetical protein CONPUDRAFT_77286 [Coniophora puteana RWD-64-598 SS2]
MGRPKIYATLEEKKDAQRRWNSSYYEKNRQNINMKARVKRDAGRISSHGPNKGAAGIKRNKRVYKSGRGLPTQDLNALEEPVASHEQLSICDRRSMSDALYEQELMHQRPQHMHFHSEEYSTAHANEGPPHPPTATTQANFPRSPPASPCVTRRPSAIMMTSPLWPSSPSPSPVRPSNTYPASDVYTRASPTPTSTRNLINKSNLSPTMEPSVLSSPGEISSRLLALFGGDIRGRLDELSLAFINSRSDARRNRLRDETSDFHSGVDIIMDSARETRSQAASMAESTGIQTQIYRLVEVVRAITEIYGIMSFEGALGLADMRDRASCIYNKTILALTSYSLSVDDFHPILCIVHQCGCSRVYPAKFGTQDQSIIRSHSAGAPARLVLTHIMQSHTRLMEPLELSADSPWHTSEPTVEDLTAMPQKDRERLKLRLRLDTYSATRSNLIARREGRDATRRHGNPLHPVVYVGEQVSLIASYVDDPDDVLGNDFAIWSVDGCKDAIDFVNDLALRYINRTPQGWGLRLISEFDGSKTNEETPDGDLSIVTERSVYLLTLHEAIHRVQDSLRQLVGSNCKLYRRCDAVGRTLTRHIAIAEDVAARLRRGPVEMYEVWERKLFLWQDEPL